MKGKDEALSKAMAEGNELFARVGAVIEKQVSAGATELNVEEIARDARIELDSTALKELNIDPVVHVLPWLPWYHWFPWQLLWCWWWRRHYPWYRCWPSWWWGCCCCCSPYGFHPW
jgi:hypothetical protein